MPGLAHIGEPPRPPPISPARGPPARDDDPEPMPDGDLIKQPEPDFAFDQRVSREPPSLSQGTVQPLSSSGVTLPRRCRCRPPGTRAPAPPRRPSALQLGVDPAPHPR